MFSGWIYDHLKPHTTELKVAHPLMLRAIAAAKKKNDRIDANKICDCLRCDFLPECYMAPTAIRQQRRALRYRNLLVRQMVQMKIKISTLLMEAGVSYNKRKLHKAGYFRELLATNPHIDDGLRALLRLCPETVVRLSKTENALVRSLQGHPLLLERVERLMSIPAIGPITALTWALEIGEVQRFSAIKKAISYCGLCGDEQPSANSAQRTPTAPTVVRIKSRRNISVHLHVLDWGLPRAGNTPIWITAVVVAAAPTENDHVSEVIRMHVAKHCRLCGCIEPSSLRAVRTKAMTHFPSNWRSACSNNSFALSVGASTT